MKLLKLNYDKLNSLAVESGVEPGDTFFQETISRSINTVVIHVKTGDKFIVPTNQMKERFIDLTGE